MKPERINEVIAEHCGALTGWICPNCGHLEPEQVLYAEECESCLSPVVNRSPDYCGDLNAIHEAVKRLNRNVDEYLPGGFGLYLAALEEVCDYDLDAQIEATAAQRAEAFVRAINKWEEE